MDDLHVADDAERAVLAETLSHAFGFPVEDAPAWFERAKPANLRAYREGGVQVGGLIVIPMGQYFGRRAVPMTGVAGVGVAPEHRGTGAATRMMVALVRELYAQGVALSTLYPATVPLYQRAGYERAGARYAVVVSPHQLPAGDRSALRKTPLAAVGEGPTLDLYTRQARVRAGALARGPYVWSRINKPYKATPRFVGLEGDAGLEGYLGVVHRSDDGHDTEVAVVDAVAVTARAADALLGLLGGYRSLARKVRWFGAPHEPLAQRLRDRFHEAQLDSLWMVRVVHVAAALEARGYSPAVRGALALRVRDELIPGNDGAFRLEVEGGTGRVTRGGGGGLALDVRALAALYTGFRSATALAQDGLVEGSEDALALADALFAGPAPAMGEMF